MCRKSGQVVERFEKGNFAHDEECYRQYIAALVETGQQSKVMPEILGRLERERGKITNAAVSATKIERAHMEFRPGGCNERCAAQRGSGCSK